MKAVKIISTALVFLILFFGIQRLLVPKYMDGLYYGALIGEYYNEKEKNHQVIFLGDCEVYENFSPVALWEEYGISSYIRGGPQQMIWQSYYMLEDTLRCEKPDIVVLDVLPMIYDSPQSETFNRINIDGMAFSLTKIKAAKASLMEGESLLSYIFPIFRFHDRWKDINSGDFENYFSPRRVGHNGYLMRNGVKPVGSIPEAPPILNRYFEGKNYEYLNKITCLCKENGIELVLIKVPTLTTCWYDDWDRQIIDFAKKHDLLYVNLLDHISEAGLDFKFDTYDAGRHLNSNGAEKLTKYLGAVLKEEFEIEDLRNKPKINSIWEEKIINYNEMKKQQLDELKKNGKVSTYTYK